jgi:hypothetical protein
MEGEDKQEHAAMRVSFERSRTPASKADVAILVVGGHRR